jgi:hypothetical protein
MIVSGSLEHLRRALRSYNSRRFWPIKQARFQPLCRSWEFGLTCVDQAQCRINRQDRLNLHDRPGWLPKPMCLKAKIRSYSKA